MNLPTEKGRRAEGPLGGPDGSPVQAVPSNTSRSGADKRHSHSTTPPPAPVGGPTSAGGGSPLDEVAKAAYDIGYEAGRRDALSKVVTKLQNLNGLIEQRKASNV